MKRLIIIALIFVSSGHLFSQAPDISVQSKEEMKKLSYLVGDWKGVAIHKGPKGSVTVMQQEHIESRLQGLVMVIEGTGRQKNETTKQDDIVFQALAVVNFDAIGKEYKLKSFVKEGYTTNAYFKVIEGNHFEWGFDIPTGGKTRYNIILDTTKKTWHEIGEYSKDGTQWYKFIELNLVKQDN